MLGREGGQYSAVRSCCDIITQLFVSEGRPLQIKMGVEVTSLKDETDSLQAVSQTQDEEGFPDFIFMISMSRKSS